MFFDNGIVLVDFAQRFDHFERAVKYWLLHADPDGADQRAAAEHDDRALHHSRTAGIETRPGLDVHLELGAQTPQRRKSALQFVGVQATLNVVTGERYSSVPQELVLYCRGYYGQSPGPIDPNVLDRVVGDLPPIDPTAYYHEKMIEKARSEKGPLSDEELLTAIFLNPDALETFNRNRKPIEWDPSARMPLMVLLKELCKRSKLRLVPR